MRIEDKMLVGALLVGRHIGCEAVSGGAHRIWRTHLARAAMWALWDLLSGRLNSKLGERTI